MSCRETHRYPSFSMFKSRNKEDQMGLISKTAMTKWMHNNKIRYEERGYVFTKYKDELEVNIKDLSNSSHVLVNVKCDCGNCKNPYLKPMTWVNYLTNVHKDNKIIQGYSCCL